MYVIKQIMKTEDELWYWRGFDRVNYKVGDLEGIRFSIGIADAGKFETKESAQKIIDLHGISVFFEVEEIED